MNLKEFRFSEEQVRFLKEEAGVKFEANAPVILSQDERAPLYDVLEDIEIEEVTAQNQISQRCQMAVDIHDLLTDAPLMKL